MAARSIVSRVISLLRWSATSALVGAYPHRQSVKNMASTGPDPSLSAVHAYLRDDHLRLDRYLQQARGGGTCIDHAAYDHLRRGLLRHIAMEEKVLFPVLKARFGDRAASQLERLRVEHSAIAALLVPTPTPALLDVLNQLLNAHNTVEEGTEGIYALTAQLSEAEITDLLARLEQVPDVRVQPYADKPAVFQRLQQALHRAGYPELLEKLGLPA